MARTRDSLGLSGGSQRFSAPGSAGEMHRIEEHSSPVLYDEFAIGWNEIFDQDQWAPDSPLFPRASAVMDTPRERRPSTGAALRQSMMATTPRSEENQMLPMVQAASSSSPCNRSEAASEDPAGEQNAFWSTEMASRSKKKKKLPEYLRIAGRGKQSAIERSMKERLLDCPTSQVRKPAQVMESELELLRHAVTAEHSMKRREARQLRRLQRRCRVKDSEDLDELQERYPPRECLRALPDPAEKAHTPRQGMHFPSKEFFQDIRSRRAPSPAPVQIAVTWRVGGAAPHTVR